VDRIATTGANLCTWSLGAGEEPPVVMLHGWVTGNMATWYPAYATQLASDRKVILYDQRGHGESRLDPTTGLARFDLDSASDDLGLIIDHHVSPGTQVDVVAYSMGAVVALRFALRFPERLRRLVLVDAPMPASRYVAPSLHAVTSPEALHALFTFNHVKLEGRRYAKVYERASRLFFDSSMIADLQTMDAEPDAALANLRLPVQLAYGTHSSFRAAGVHLLSQLPDVRMEWIEGDHDIVYNRVAVLLPLIKRFLAAA